MAKWLHIGAVLSAWRDVGKAMMLQNLKFASACSMVNSRRLMRKCLRVGSLKPNRPVVNVQGGLK